MAHPRLLGAFLLLATLLAPPAAIAAVDQEAPPAIPPTPPPTFSSTDLIVQWVPGTNRGDKAEARADAEVELAHDLGSSSFQLVSVEPGQQVGEALDELEANPVVALAERDSYSAPNAIPNDPRFGELWGLSNLGPPGIAGFSGALAGDDIDALDAWTQTVGIPSTVIADLDTGYRFEHPDLESVAWTNPGESGEKAANGIDDDGDGIVDDVHGADFVGPNADVKPTVDGNPTDEDLLSGGHGVHTAGTMGAVGNNEIGITGVAQNARIMPLRVCSRSPSAQESRCPTSSQIAAINYAREKKARVANMSLGGNAPSQAVVNAIAAAKQTLFVISAGNDGSNNDLPAAAPHGHHYPCDYTPQTEASPPVPGAVDNIVCVAATNQADELASFSDWGATSVDLGAPGTEILSTYPYVTPLDEQFTAEDFASKWPDTGADGGFQRTDEAPLTSFGMTDLIGPPVADTVRETTSSPVTIPANGGCKLNQTRRVSLASGDHYRYSVLLDGVEKISREPGSTAEPGLDRRFLELPAAFDDGGEVQVRFRFTAGSAPAPGSGVWLDDISIVCAQAVGQADGYGFLQGTSMAAPHVTGAAALLFSLKSSATVTEARNALLSGVDPVASLAGKTVSGGRLDVFKAMAALDEVEEPPADEEAPAAPQLIATVPSSPANEGHPRIVGTAEAGAIVHIYEGAACGGLPTTGTAAELTSPGIAVSVPSGSTRQFSATATDEALNRSACSAPISYTNSSGEDKPPLPIVLPSLPSRRATPCVVPKLTGKTLGRAKVALAAAHCTLGEVTKAKAKRGRRPRSRVVMSTTPRAGAKPASGKVNLKLTPKPKPKKHHD